MKSVKSVKSVKSAKSYDRKTFFVMNSSYWNPHELPVLPYSKIVSREETTVSAELTENWILNETLLKTFLRRGGFYGFYRFYGKKEMKIKTIIIIIIIIIFIMIVIIYLILLFREIRCIQPKSRVSSLIPSLKFLFKSKKSVLSTLMEYNSGVRECQLYLYSGGRIFRIWRI